MALHPDITRKDDMSVALGMAADALLIASTQQTGNAGSVTIQNADGSKTLMGEDAGDTTVARFVGRVTPPNRPTGIHAESHMGTLFVAWDGTLDGGMDAAFLFTRITITYTDADGDHSVDLGDLRGKGSVGSTTLPAGTVVTVTARAYDDAHDETGRSMPNVSAPSDPITVTIVDEAAQLKADVTADIKVVSDKADKAQAAADKANDANTQLRSDVSARLDVVDDTVSGVRTDVDKATAAAAKNANDIDAANTKIVQTNTRVDGVSTTISNVSQNADSALSLSTQNHQDLTGFQTTVSNTYSTKTDTLSQVSAVSQKADSISASLSKDYQKTGDADSKYATKTALQATADGITASVSETYATKSVVDALKNIADNAIETWQGHGVPSMTGEPTSDWTTPELKKQHSGDMYYDLDTGYSYRFGSADGSTYTWDKISDSDITRAMQAAADAQSDADKANAGVSKLNTDIPATYATKSDVNITTDGIKTDVSKAMTLGQTGIDNAATVDQKADGIQATVTQQAQTISDNVKAIAQVNMRADSLSTSITQVSGKADLALANARDLVVDGGFSHGFTYWSQNPYSGVSMSIDSNNRFVVDDTNTSSYSWVRYITQDLTVPAINADRTFRVEYDVICLRQAEQTMFVSALGTKDSLVDLSTLSTAQTTHVVYDFVLVAGKPITYIRVAHSAGCGGSAAFDNISLKDITEAKSAQNAADNAQSTANTAVSQSSQLSQDLSGFKTSVGQTYETKTDSTSKATTAQQNLDGFKTSVASTYVDKTTAGNTYSTKTETQQTKDSLSSQITAVGDTANSAMTQVTSAQQDLAGFKNSVSSTYATKQALSDTDGKAVAAGTTANLALANAQELIGNGRPDSPTPVLSGWTYNATDKVWERVFPGGESHNDFLWIGIPFQVSNRDRIYHLSLDARVTSGTVTSSDSFTFGHCLGGWPNVSVGNLTSSWSNYSGDTTVNANATVVSGQSPHAYMSSYVSSTGAKTIQVRNVSLRDITEVAQLQSDVAATYASKTSVEQTATQITSQVETKYATKDALSQTDSKVDQKADEWSVQLSTISSRADAITSTTDDLSDQIATTNSNVDNINGTLSDEIASRQAYMRFSQEADGDPALELGASSSPNKVVLTNDRLSFKSNDAEVAYVGNDQMNINNANVTRTLRIGNFMFAPRADGHLTLTRI